MFTSPSIPPSLIHKSHPQLCCELSSLYAPVSMGLNRSWWDTLHSSLLWTLADSPGPSSFLKVSSQYTEIHCSGNHLEHTYQDPRRISYQVIYCNHSVLRTREETDSKEETPVLKRQDQIADLRITIYPAADA